MDTDNEEVLAGPQENRADLSSEIEDKKIRESDKTKVVKVPSGTLVVKAEQSGSDTSDADAYYVLRDQPALGGTDIKNPEQNFDQGPGGGGGPNVTFDFTGKGRKAWEETTREIAQRGTENNFGGDARQAFQHFAIVLDNEIISAPFIDFNQNPDGIDPVNGSQISGGFTIKSAQNLANLLKTGALPLELDLISASAGLRDARQAGAQPGSHRGSRRARCSSSLFLLVFYRVLGVIAVGALGVYTLFMFALVKLIPITLTLPGIAGLILTIGVAADANIVIFERVKEEVRAGQVDSRRDLPGLQEGPDGDHRRERRDVHGRVHPVRARDLGRQGLRVHARRRHARLVHDGGAADAGRARRGRALADDVAPVGAGRAARPVSASAGTTWAVRSTSSRCPA